MSYGAVPSHNHEAYEIYGTAATTGDLHQIESRVDGARQDLSQAEARIRDLEGEVNDLTLRVRSLES